jgi:type I restriction enzyme, S subunit
VKTGDIQLGEVCEFLYGASLKEEKRRPGKVPVYGSNGVVGWHERAITTGPTIIIGRKGSIGEVNWSSEPCFPIDTTYYIEKTKKPCDLRWLFFMLLKLDLTRLNKSAAVPGLNRDDAYEQLVPFPDLYEQQRITARMEQADRLHRTRRYALELSGRILPAVFLELFGSPAEAAKTFPSSELGEVTNFVDYRGIAPNKTASGVRLVTARNIKRGHFEIEPQEFIPAEEYTSWMSRGFPRPGDVLFTTEGHTLGSAAKLPSFEKVALAQRLIALQPKEQITSDYLLYVILHPSFQDRVVKHSTGSAARGISSKNLADLPIPLPPLSLQQKFASLAQRVERLRRVQQESLRQAEHLFQTLLHHSFTRGLAPESQPLPATIVA